MMKVDKQNTPELERLAALISGARAGMLTTYDTQQKIMHSRPLATLRMDGEPALWFLTSMKSPKIRELDEQATVCVSFTSGDDYVSVSGPAEILRERSIIKELWEPIAKTWFPDGPDDPDLGALKVSIHHAEYWDGPGNRLSQLFSVALAGLTGAGQPLGDNVKLDV